MRSARALDLETGSPIAAVAAAMIVLALCAEAAEDIVGYFKEYSQRQVVGASYQGPLDFLRNAAAQQWALNLGARSTG